MLPANITSGEMRIVVIGPDGHGGGPGKTWKRDVGSHARTDTTMTCSASRKSGGAECGHEGDYWYEGDKIAEAYRYARNYPLRQAVSGR